MNNSICFSGHRAEKLQEFSGKHFNAFSEILKNIIHIRLVNYIDNGFNKFYVGMSTGIDLWIGEILVELKTSQYPYIEIIAVKPFLKHGSNFSISEKIIYKKIIDNSNEVVCINDAYSKRSYLMRNRYMVENSNKLYAIVYNENSGTGYTIKYAKEKNLSVDILSLKSLFKDFLQIESILD